MYFCNDAKFPQDYSLFLCNNGIPSSSYNESSKSVCHTGARGPSHSAQTKIWNFLTPPSLLVDSLFTEPYLLLQTIVKPLLSFVDVDYECPLESILNTLLYSQNDILATKPTLKIIILTNIHKNWRKIVDILLISKFYPGAFFSYTPSRTD